MNNLKMGDRIFFNGDMKNNSGFGTVTAVRKWNSITSYNIKFDDGREWTVEAGSFSEEYKGNGSTRFVTLDAYKRWKEKQKLEV